jgi:hypothetical protein
MKAAHAEVFLMPGIAGASFTSSVPARRMLDEANSPDQSFWLPYGNVDAGWILLVQPQRSAGQTSHLLVLSIPARIRPSRSCVIRRGTALHRRTLPVSRRRTRNADPCFSRAKCHCQVARQPCLVIPSSPSALQQRIPSMLTISRDTSRPDATRWPRRGLHKRLEFLGVGTWSVSNSAAGWTASSCNVRRSQIMASPAINAQSGAS